MNVIEYLHGTICMKAIKLFADLKETWLIKMRMPSMLRLVPILLQ